VALFGWRSGFEGISGLCGDENVVWIKGWMVRFEGI